MFRALFTRLFGPRLAELEGEVAELRERFARYQSRQAMRAARAELAAEQELASLAIAAKASPEAQDETKEESGTLARRAALARSMRGGKGLQ